jgi:ribonucleoside-triphosphate reductase
MTGSIGVVTINMARLGYVYAGDKKALYVELDRLMELAKSTLEKKRVFIQEMYDRGLFPYTSRYLPGFNNHFSTIGVNGMNEMIRNFSKESQSITDKEGEAFAIEFLEHMRDRMVEFQEETGNLYNLEATPAEGTTYRFAKEDKKRYPDILQAGFDENIYYTNSSQIPANYTDDPFAALDLQDELQCKYTGGTVLHLYMREKLSSTEACRKLVKNVISNYRLPYITITPVFSICEKHGYLSGEHEFCPQCDEELVQEYKQQEESAKHTALPQETEPVTA